MIESRILQTLEQISTTTLRRKRPKMTQMRTRKIQTITTGLVGETKCGMREVTRKDKRVGLGTRQRQGRGKMGMVPRCRFSSLPNQESTKANRTVSKPSERRAREYPAVPRNRTRRLLTTGKLKRKGREHCKSKRRLSLRSLQQ
jgi:hypothetical protein